LAALIWSRSTEETARITNILNKEKIEKHVSTIMQEIDSSLLADSDDWKSLIPGRIILKKFCGEAKLDYDLFRTAYINAAELMPINPFADLITIFRDFDEFGQLNPAA
jgi:hypothetical protein